jgi:hypothetical protein
MIELYLPETGPRTAKVEGDRVGDDMTELAILTKAIDRSLLKAFP